jgi:nucleotide-binding universal stress UspA family protein
VRQRPVEALIEVATARSAELIAVGHGASGPLKGALLGSVTYEIVHRSTIPVLVVPNDEADESS